MRSRIITMFLYRDYDKYRDHVKYRAYDNTVTQDIRRAGKRRLSSRAFSAWVLVLSLLLTALLPAAVPAAGQSAGDPVAAPILLVVNDASPSPFGR